LNGLPGLDFWRPVLDFNNKIVKKTIVGIDFGSKFAGTTVICYNRAHRVSLMESSKNSDADAFILRELEYLNPDLVMIDAPLSLPGIYWLGNGYSDHFFRICDRELRAMSPMFLGGLTARAMRLQRKLAKDSLQVLETYPRRLVELLDLPTTIYKNKEADIAPFVNILIEKLGVRINSSQITNWHHLDALLAFFSGIRYLEKKSRVYGISEEGIITV
jgi:predicted nuclease with RNAse H fold